MLIIKICFIAILGILLAIQFKTQKPEAMLYIGFAVGLILLGTVIQSVMEAVDQVIVLSSYLTSGRAYLSVLLKIVGITYICEFCSAVCKDSGFTAVAGQIEVLGKVTVLFAGLPILLAVIEELQQFR